MQLNIDPQNLDNQITVRDMITLLGGRVDEYPVIGTCVSLNGRRKCERDIRDDGNVSIDYQWTSPSGEPATPENQTLCRIYIGHRLSGPMLQCDVNWEGKRSVWRNCYSKGNYGKNYSSGGTWSSEGRRVYDTATQALDHRDYQVTGITMDKSYTESGKLINEVRVFVSQFEVL